MSREKTNSLTKSIIELLKTKHIAGIFNVENLQDLYNQTEYGYADEELKGICGEVAYMITKYPKAYDGDVSEIASILRYEFIGCFHNCINFDKDIYFKFAQDIVDFKGKRTTNQNKTN